MGKSIQLDLSFTQFELLERTSHERGEHDINKTAYEMLGLGIITWLFEQEWDRPGSVMHEENVKVEF